MPTTTNFGWTYPANTDLVMNGASAMGTIATSIDTTLYARTRAVGCRLTSATGTVTSGYTVLSWNVETVDTDGFITVPSTTITIPAGLGGFYQCSVRTNTALTGSVEIGFSITWTTVAYGTTRDAMSYMGSTGRQLGGTVRGSCIGQQRCAAGDSLQVFVITTSNAASATHELILERIAL